MGTEKLREARGAGTTDDRDGREKGTPGPCQAVGEEGESQLQGGHPGWVR